MFVFSLIIFGCTEVPGRLLIMEANSRTARGDYTEAIASFLRALEHPEAEPYGEYGLGSIYFTMGEETAAINRFMSAREMLDELPAVGNRELRYRVHYNTGVVLFSTGDFSGAADSFREALRTDGSRVEAKRNLELSLMSLAQEDNSGGGRNGMESESQAVFFEFIRQWELDQWRNMEWPEEENITGPDY